jgi:hypothetical protein
MPIKPLEPLETVAITHGLTAAKIDPSARYLVFISADQDDGRFIEDFIHSSMNPLPAGTPVYVIHGDIDRAIRIYEIFDTHITHGANGK